MADPAAMIFTRSGFSIFGGLAFGIAAGVVLLRVVAGFIRVLVTKRSARLVPRLLFSAAVLSALSACVSH